MPEIHILSLVGLAPAVASETYWALLRQGNKVSGITLVTTRRGAAKIQQHLLGPLGALARVTQALTPGFSPPQIELKILCNAGDTIDDIADEDNHLATLVDISGLVRRLTKLRAPSLHASMAGGRKTMAAALAQAMSLHARPEDRLSHVLVASHYSDDPLFLYPISFKDVEAVNLIDVPFVRLRTLLPDSMLDRPIAELISTAQARVDAATPGVLNLTDQRLSFGPCIIKLSPLHAVLIAVLAWHFDGISGNSMPAHAFAKAYLATGATRKAARDLERRLSEFGADAWLRETVSRVQTRLRAELPVSFAARLTILRLGGRPRTRYALSPSALVVEPQNIFEGKVDASK